jgi:hypothetical protein
VQAPAAAGELHCGSRASSMLSIWWKSVGTAGRAQGVLQLKGESSDQLNRSRVDNCRRSGAKRALKSMLER